MDRKDGNAPERATGALQKLSPDLLQNLLYRISHDLKSPLVSLHGYLELMKLYQERIPEDMTVWVDRMHRSSLRLQGLIERILMLVRPLPDEGDGCRIREAVDQVREALQETASVEWVVDDGGDDTVRVDVPAATLTSVLWIVCENALDHGLKHQQRPRIDLSWSAEGGTIELRVEDNGVGFAPGAAPCLDDAMAAATRLDGTAGVGLVLSALAVEQFGGSLAVDGRAGSGARVTIRLPVAVSGAA